MSRRGHLEADEGDERLADLTCLCSSLVHSRCDLGLRLLGRVLGGDPRCLPHELGHRRESALPVRKAAPTQRQHLGPEAVGELMDESRLPDAGGAEHGEDVAGELGACPFERPLEQEDLALASDKEAPRRSRPASPGAATSRRSQTGSSCVALRASGPLGSARTT